MVTICMKWDTQYNQQTFASCHCYVTILKLLYYVLRSVSRQWSRFDRLQRLVHYSLKIIWLMVSKQWSWSKEWIVHLHITTSDVRATRSEIAPTFALQKRVRCPRDHAEFYTQPINDWPWHLCPLLWKWHFCWGEKRTQRGPSRH